MLDWIVIGTILALANAPAEQAVESGPVALAQRAMLLANDDPVEGIAALREALAAFEDPNGSVTSDREAQKVRTLAQLTLARTLLSTGDPVGARDAMDEALRTARGDDLPVKGFGPGLDALHRERIDALEGSPRGSIKVHCADPCRVLINEREASTTTENLRPGPYRVYVTSMGDAVSGPLELQLDVDGPQTVDWPQPAPRPAPAAATPERTRDRVRILPRWSEAVLVAAGVAAMGVGAVLIGIEGRCPGGHDPLDTENCPEVYTTQMSGIATLAAGGAVFLVSGVLLTVDEVRVGRGQTRTVGLALRGQF